MRYESYQYLYPPRPDHAISPELLDGLEGKGYVAQVKKNGTNTVLFVRPSTGELIAKTRHKDDHKLWSPNREYLKPFLALPGDGWYVFVAELLHSKVKDMRDILYVHDVLVINGTYLVGYSQDYRYERLRAMFLPYADETDSHWVLTPHLWVAKQYRDGFKALYDSLENADDEGIVLKLAEQTLNFAIKPDSNNGGMLKSRKTHKNFTF